MTGAHHGGQPSARTTALGCPPWCVRTHDDDPSYPGLVVHIGSVDWAEPPDVGAFMHVTRADRDGRPGKPMIFLYALGSPSSSLDLPTAQTLVTLLAGTKPSRGTRSMIAALRRAIAMATKGVAGR